MPPSPKQQAASVSTTPEQLRKLAFKSHEIDRIIARNLNTDPELLQDLYLSTDQLTRQGIATNPHTPTKVLYDLGAEFPEELFNNRIFQQLLQEKADLETELPLSTLKSLVNQTDLPLKFRIELALRTSEHEFLFGLVMDPNLPLVTLEKLVKRGDRSVGGVAEAAALHVNWPSDSPITRENYDDLDEELRAFAGAYKEKPHIRTTWVELGLIPEWLLKSGGPEGYLSAASSIRSPKLLAELADPYLRGNKEYYVVMKKLARNPLSPEEVLTKLWQLEQKTWEEWKPLHNRQYNLFAIQFAQEQYGEVGFCPQLAGHPNTPVPILEELAQLLAFEDIQELLEAGNILDSASAALARNPNTPNEILKRLWIEPSPLVLIGLLQNPQTESHDLEIAAQHDDVNVRRQVAKQPLTPAHVLSALAFDEFVSVARAALSNPNLPIDVVQNLMTVESDSAAKLIPDAVRIYWSRVSNFPPSVTGQLEEQDINCLLGLSRNPMTSAHILEALAQLVEGKYEEGTGSKYEEVRISVAKHPNTSISTLRMLAQDSSQSVREVLCDRPDLPEEILGLLPMASTKLPQENCSPARLRMFLEAYYQTHHNPSLSRLALLASPHLSPQFLEKVASSNIWQERWMISRHSNAPKAVLEKLAQDANRVVRADARKNLQSTT